LQLDAGEAEAIALAVEINADRILIDERRGRQKAIELSLKPIGILGILLKAKQENIISAVKPLLDKLINEADFYVHPNLYNEVLALANE
jgi:predicted nucleic acid-binding protein